MTVERLVKGGMLANVEEIKDEKYKNKYGQPKHPVCCARVPVGGIVHATSPRIGREHRVEQHKKLTHGLILPRFRFGFALVA